MKKLIIILMMVTAILLLGQVSYSNSVRKIIYIDSYHEEAAWSIGITDGITSVLSTRNDIELKIFHMDTKRKQSEKAKKAALEILSGRSPEDIPIVSNKRAKIILNMKLAIKMDIRFPMELINNATFLDQGEF